METRKTMQERLCEFTAVMKRIHPQARVVLTTVGPADDTLIESLTLEITFPEAVAVSSLENC